MADTASPVVSESTIMLSLWSLVVQLQGNTVTLTLPQCATSSELLCPLGLWTATPSAIPTLQHGDAAPAAVWFS